MAELGLTRSLRHGQALGEQVDDIAPGPLCVAWVVADAGDHGLVDRRVMEGVQRAAVDHLRTVEYLGQPLLKRSGPTLCGQHKIGPRTQPFNTERIDSRLTLDLPRYLMRVDHRCAGRSTNA